MKTGGQILVNCLKTQGVDRVFCVPGESYLAVLDALHDAPEIDVVVCRQEGGAAMMADAHARLTGKPGVCMVTRGPGATNASGGIHISFQDSVPVVMFVGDVGREMRDREAFQEVDFSSMFASLAKRVDRIDDPGRVPEYVGRAFATTMAGRPGPAIVVLPEDMLREPADPTGYVAVPAPDKSPSLAALDQMENLLAHAERPLILAGGSGWDQAGVDGLVSFAENWDLPVACTFRFQDRFPNDHANYVGDVGIGPNPRLRKMVEDADVVLALGVRLGEMSTGGYSLFDIPVPKQSLIHVHPGPEEIGMVYQPVLGITAGAPETATAMAGRVPPNNRPWAGRTETGNASYSDWTRPVTNPGGVQMSEVIDHINTALPADTIISNGAGNYTGWPNRFFKYRTYGSQLAPTSGSMGYGVPAAIAAKIARPDQTVIGFAGDGCFMMNGQELATAVQYGANVIIIVVNNGMYGTIRMHQEREYPARISATHLNNPDFTALAIAYGAHGERVESTDEFAPALERCLKAGKTALIEILLDPDAISHSTTLAAVREKALANQ